MNRNRVSRPFALFAAAGLLAFALPAAGATLGPRLGLTVDPDQVHGGLAINAGYLSPGLNFRPAFDLGVGDNLVGFDANMDFKYTFSQGPGNWSPFLGGGPALHYFNETDGNDSDTNVGASFFGGMQAPAGAGNFYGEARLGLVEAPDFKFTVGWMFSQ
jgi:hypothetical protein